MMLRRTLILALLAAILTVVPAQALGAAAPQADLIDIEDEVMCVTCKIPLNIAEGAQPDSQRELIRELIAQGRTKQAIKDELVAQYGPQVLALPEDDGFGLTAYVIPLLLGALVVGGLALLVPRWRRRPAAGMSSAAGDPGPEANATRGLSATDAERLDADLARYEG